VSLAGSPCRCQETLPKASSLVMGWSRTRFDAVDAGTIAGVVAVSKWELRPGAPNSPPTRSARPRLADFPDGVHVGLPDRRAATRHKARKISTRKSNL